MKILMLAQFFPPDIGGEERHVLNLSEILARRGHEVCVATQLLAGTAPREVLSSGVRVYRFPSTAMRLAGWYSDPNRPHHPPIPDPRLTRELSRLIERERPDVVHAHNWIVNSAVAIRGGGPGRHRFALVLTLHDYSNRCATKRMMRSGRPCAGPTALRCLSCAASHYGPVVGLATAAAMPVMRAWKNRAVDHLVSVSTAVATGNRVADSGVPSSIIPNFVPDELVDSVPDELVDSPGPAAGPDWAEPGPDSAVGGPDSAVGGPDLAAGGPPPADLVPGDLPASDFVAGDLPEGEFLFFAGDLTRDKGVPILLEAYQAAGPDCPPLLMVGRRAQDTPAALPPGVRIVERWPHHKIMEAFRRCLLAVLPSTWPDPCPTTVLEVMAAGRPVITTRTGGMVDLVEDGVSGVLVAPGDAAGLAAALRWLLADRGARERMAAAGRSQVRRFTASRVADRLEDVYRRAVAR